MGPWMLAPEQKACLQQYSEENLDMLRANPENFFSRIITRDETWIDHHDPQTKEESMQWKHKGSPPSKKFRLQQSAGKIMHGSSFFGTQKVFCFWNLCHTRQPLLGTYASTMVALHKNIKQKCRGKLSAAVLLLHDNASAHEPCTSRAAIRKCGFVELNQPPYSPDLATSDYFLFRNLKNVCVGDDFPAEK